MRYGFYIMTGGKLIVDKMNASWLADNNFIGTTEKNKPVHLFYDTNNNV